MKNFYSWLRQPSTIHGLGVLAFGLVAALSQLFSGNTELSMLLGVASYILIHLGINDNTAGVQQAEQLSQNIISDVEKRQVVQDVPQLINDANSVLQTVVGDKTNAGS